MSKGKKLKVAALDPNLTKADVEALIADIAADQRRYVDRVQTADEAKAAIDALLGQELAPIGASLKVKLAIVFAWAEKNRAEICSPGTKTAKFATGQVVWRFDPKSVKLKDVPAVLLALKERGLHNLIRTSEDVDKDAILKDEAAVAAVPGITIVQAEQIVLKPNQTDIEPVELARKVAA